MLREVGGGVEGGRGVERGRGMREGGSVREGGRGKERQSVEGGEKTRRFGSRLKEGSGEQGNNGEQRTRCLREEGGGSQSDLVFLDLGTEEVDPSLAARALDHWTPGKGTTAEASHQVPGLIVCECVSVTM